MDATHGNKAFGFTPIGGMTSSGIDVEVIGNAFDNPELMKEGVQP